MRWSTQGCGTDSGTDNGRGSKAGRSRCGTVPPSWGWRAWLAAIGDRDRGLGLGDGLGLDRSGGSGECAGPAGHLAVGERAGLEVDGARAVEHAAVNVPGDVDL